MRRFFADFRCGLAVVLFSCFLTCSLAWAQHVTGKVDVTVVDPDGAVVPDAQLILQDLATNYTRTAATQASGIYSFVNLDIGSYKLTVSKPGFQPQEFNPITVSSTKTTALNVKLNVGQATQSVVVEGGVAPVLETTTNTIGTTIDLKQIESLPLSGRDLTQLSRLTPGYNGTWNGLPSIAQGNNVDGVIGSPSRMKFSGNSQSSISPRLEDIEEMTVQTDQLDLNQGFGQAAMQINYVTRRGTNALHGRFFEDYRNSALNANSWTNNAAGLKKPNLILNDFGGSVGGPVFRDKLFFFFSLANSRRPGGVPASATYLTDQAQTGIYTYQGTDGQSHSINLFNIAAGYNTANGTSLPTSVNSTIGSQLSSINSAVTAGATSATTDPIINSVNWNFPAPTIIWYPTFRIDYNTSRAVTMNFAFNRTKRTDNGAIAPFFPGDQFSGTGSGNQTDAFTASYGINWTIRPTMINQFKVGYLYNVTRNAYNTSRAYEQDPNRVNWPVFAGTAPDALTSPANWIVPVTQFYPLINVSDTFSWQHGSHSMNFGFSFYREQDHYWNPPELRNVNLGVVDGDPAMDAFSNAGAYQPLPGANSDQQAEAQALFATLTGRISGVSGSFPLDPASQQYIQQPALAYNLNELSKAYGLFFQDAWRIRPTLTLNYGLRWDFTGAQHDITSAYHNADVESIFGPSGVNNLFNPGSLHGTDNPVLAERSRPYKDWNVSPQPVFGFAWNPQFGEGLLGKIAGGSDTVIRGGYSLRKFTVPYQYFWNNASDYGSFFYQFYSLNPSNNGTTGTYAPGSLSLGDTFPAYLLEPSTYQAVAPASEYTFIGGAGINGMNPKIGQPYTQSWNLSIQRKVGNAVLEVRYNGNRTLNQWINLNINEVNVFENGFLDDFKNAQHNLQVNGGTSFGNINPAGGTVPVPILTAAFTGSQTGSQTDPNFSRGSFITNLQNGQVGSLANTLSNINGAAPYFCNLVGTNFSPCATNIGYTGAGAGYPANFFLANPYAISPSAFSSGNSAGYMTDAGYSTYNALQVDFRQRAWHGVTFDANYTWSHTLGVSTPNDWTGAYPQFTLRDLHQSYGPTLYDLRHVVHVNATADLPFGKGRAFLNQGGAVDKVFGGWTVGTIMTYQSGYPFRVLGGNQTFNNFADSGVVLNGISRQQLQDAVGVYRIPGKSTVSLIDPSLLLTPGGAADPSKIAPNTTPGTIAPTIYLYGPHGFYDDIAITKQIPITERWRFTFQTEILNAFNHPVFGQAAFTGPPSIKSGSWGTGRWNDPRAGGISGFNRQIEFRANITF